MTKEKKEKKPPVLRPAQEGGRVGSPLFWVALLGVPLALGLAISIVRATNGREPAPVAPAEIAAASQPAVTQEAAVGTTVSEPDAPPRRMVEPPKEEAYPCDFAPWVGLKVTPDIIEAINQAKRGYRILPPGSSMTMDYSPSRINFEVDEEGTITRISCG